MHVASDVESTLADSLISIGYILTYLIQDSLPWAGASFSDTLALKQSNPVSVPFLSSRIRALLNPDRERPDKTLIQVISSLWKYESSNLTFGVCKLRCVKE